MSLARSIGRCYLAAREDSDAEMYLKRAYCAACSAEGLDSDATLEGLIAEDQAGDADEYEPLAALRQIAYLVARYGEAGDVARRAGAIARTTLAVHLGDDEVAALEHHPEGECEYPSCSCHAAARAAKEGERG